ncbi:MAG: CBS domain-containing protein [Candidatus Eiseniibacteriota bacterium]
MGRVSDILGHKGGHVHAVDAEATVHEAIARMVEHNVGALVVKSGTAFVGIFTERDHLRRVTLDDRPPRDTRVREVMTPKVICVTPDEMIQGCLNIMTQERIRHLPVVDGGAVIGMISIGDLVKHLSQQHEVEIRYLTEYITGIRPA